MDTYQTLQQHTLTASGATYDAELLTIRNINGDMLQYRLLVDDYRSILDGDVRL